MDVTDDGPRTPEGPQDPVAALRDRVAALEAENTRLLERYASALEAENARMRAADMPAPPRPAPMTVPALARDLTRVEDLLAEVDRLVAVGDERGAARARVGAARLACDAFTRVCDDADFRQRMMEARALPWPGAAPRDLSMPFADFRAAEVAVLRLVGLSDEQARRHVDAAIAAFEDPVTGVERPPLMDDLRALRDAMCQGADALTLGLRRDASRARWRRVLTYGLGGTVIVAANGLGLALLGPAGVAASQAVGSAAVGVAAAHLA